MRKVTFKPTRVLGERCGSEYHVIVVTSSRPQAAKRIYSLSTCIYTSLIYDSSSNHVHTVCSAVQAAIPLIYKRSVSIWKNQYSLSFLSPLCANHILVLSTAGSSQSSSAGASSAPLVVAPPSKPLAVLKRLMGELPSVIRVDLRPKLCSNLTCIGKRSRSRSVTWLPITAQGMSTTQIYVTGILVGNTRQNNHKQIRCFGDLRLPLSANTVTTSKGV